MGEYYNSNKGFNNSLRLALLLLGCITKKDLTKKIEDEVDNKYRDTILNYRKLVNKYGFFWKESKKDELRDLALNRFDEFKNN